MFENDRKSLEVSYVYILSGQKFNKKMPKMLNLANFWKPESSAKIEKLKCDILGDFQTLCLNG